MVHIYPLLVMFMPKGVVNPKYVPIAEFQNTAYFQPEDLWVFIIFKKFIISKKFIFPKKVCLNITISISV